MPNIVPLNRTGALTRRDPAMLKLFARTVGKHLNATELDEALVWCELFGANPFSRDIYMFLFDANDAEKRRLVPVLGIGLYRKIAARSVNYRPDDRPARFTYDENLIGPANPKGIVDCEVTVYRHAHGEWFPITERLRWEERAPIVKEGEDGTKWEPMVGSDGKPILYPEGHAKAGKQKHRKVAVGEVMEKLDPGKKNWATMPETMLSKCVEAAAIRKGWPNETAGSYVEGELDAANTIELTATEIIQKTEQEDRYARIGGPNSLVVDWGDGKELDRVPAGQFFDRVTAWLNEQEKGGHFSVVSMWAIRNRRTMNEFWALEKDAALKLKKRLEEVEAKLVKQP